MLLVSRRLPDAAHQDHRQQHHDEERRNVKAEMPSRIVEIVPGQVLQPRRQVCGRNPLQRQVHAEPVHQVHDVRRESHAHAHVAEGVFQDQVPADNPRRQLTHGRVGVGIRRAGDRNHRRNLGITQARKSAHHGNEHQRERQRRACARPPRQRRVQNQVVNQRGVCNRRSVEVLPRHGRADHRKNARADHRADAQSRKRPRPQALLQRMLRLLRIAKQLVNRFAGKQLAGQCGSPCGGEGRRGDSLQFSVVGCQSSVAGFQLAAPAAAQVK